MKKGNNLVQGEPLSCPQCTAEMEFVERLKNGKTKEGFYRRRKFRCSICLHEEIIYADGAKDLRHN